MDIQIVDVIDKYFVVPQSVVGTLWLQTHFCESDWDELTRGAVILQRDDATFLIMDAEDAGLTVKYN